MQATLRPALDFDLATLADLFSRGFEGYFVPIAETPEGLAARLRYDSLDLALSRVALVDGRPGGILFTAVRGWRCRIAAMGVVAEARRRGVGRRLMEGAIDACRGAGMRRMVLEVIEQNGPAVGLYRSLGFEVERRLVGYELPTPGPGVSPGEGGGPPLEEIDPWEVGRRITQDGDEGLPWQLTADTLGTRGLDLAAFRFDEAFALVHDRGDGAVVLEALVVSKGLRRGGLGSRMVHALGERYPGRPWRIPGRVPEDLAPSFFAGLGFRPLPISQWEMGLDL
ncbi:MAG: N-acetyltransferase [Acidobacteriota bacterium]